ncbi:unnamed protein product [Cylicocyclus nassatus]|uniref:Uncharacterized protein n=1 Tax=Cylicocyclus nassatus TaxID=53992 RepID=A0AA36DSA5_CYLNA|nr:unnamed protein product [Cylicocyclus nassatus]
MLILRVLFLIVSVYSASIGPSKMSPESHTMQQKRRSGKVSRSINQKFIDFSAKQSTIGKVRNRVKRQFFFPGYYNSYNSFGNYYYPSYPGYFNSYYYPSYSYFNPLGTGSLWAAGGGLLGNTLSFFIGK